METWALERLTGRVGCTLVSALTVAAALSSSVAAKEFAPGDLRICGVDRCLPVVDPRAVALLARSTTAT